MDILYIKYSSEYAKPEINRKLFLSVYFCTYRKKFSYIFESTQNFHKHKIFNTTKHKIEKNSILKHDNLLRKTAFTIHTQKNFTPNKFQRTTEKNLNPSDLAQRL